MSYSLVSFSAQNDGNGDEEQNSSTSVVTKRLKNKVCNSLRPFSGGQSIVHCRSVVKEK